MKKIKIIILDDSLFMREALQKELERDVNISVVTKAASAYEARDKIIEFRPDILISDINLGEMTGIDFVRKLLPQYYIPVIMISTDESMRAQSLGVNAVDFIPKPKPGNTYQTEIFYNKIVTRIKAIANDDHSSYDIEKYSSSLIAIGASTGGAEAVVNIINELPGILPPIVVAQHMPERFTKTFSERLNATSALSVKEGIAQERLIPGQVYIAPGGMHTVVQKRKGNLYLSCLPDTTPGKPCPNIDYLFNSVADATKGNSIGVILTGMGRDGAVGLKKMRDSGSYTIGQDESTSVVYGMPRAAYEIGAVSTQLPLNKIAKQILASVEKL